MNSFEIPLGFHITTSLEIGKKKKNTLRKSLCGTTVVKPLRAAHPFSSHGILEEVRMSDVEKCLYYHTQWKEKLQN